MNKPVTISSQPADRLVWAKALPEDRMWSVQGADLDFTLHDTYGMFCEVDPEGALVIIQLQRGQLCGLPVAVKGEHEEDQMLRHFMWVRPGMEHIQCMLWRVLNFIRVPELWFFYYSILTSDQIMEPLYRAKGSHDHHHNYPGGLLEHSYDVASSAATHAKQYCLGHTTIWISFVAGLLHDIGKIGMFYNQERGGVCVQHEALSFMLLSEPLAELQQVSPNLFEALSSTLTAKAGRHQPQYLPETIVRMCDRLSVEINMCRKAFSTMPAYYWYAKSDIENRVHKRLDLAS